MTKFDSLDCALKHMFDLFFCQSVLVHIQVSKSVHTHFLHNNIDVLIFQEHVMYFNYMLITFEMLLNLSFLYEFLSLLRCQVRSIYNFHRIRMISFTAVTLLHNRDCSRSQKLPNFVVLL